MLTGLGNLAVAFVQSAAAFATTLGFGLLTTQAAVELTDSAAVSAVGQITANADVRVGNLRSYSVVYGVRPIMRD